MYKIERVKGPLSEREWGLYPGDADGLVAFRGSEVLARLAFGASSGFSGAPGLTGYVGWYHAADGEAGADLLRRAVQELFNRGARRVVGPLDGSTWHRYRFTLPGTGKPDSSGNAFLGEPVNPPEYPLHFESAGFQPHLEYQSRIVRRPATEPESGAVAAKLTQSGVEVRGLDVPRFTGMIREIHQLSLIAFAENPYFTSIDLTHFESLYAPLRPLVDPELVRMAWSPDGRLLGFVFAYSDPLSSEPRVILKTLASHPEVRGMGLGGLLTSQIDAAAALRGASVIHALMQLFNFSGNISQRSESELFRRYRLYIADRH
ncbi:hypothetical protein BH23GEM6_BH23GEM6_18750 [soil metagenome]